ncbi:MAG TPA: ABC transporter ATP-binding protein, partial [Ilumatobacteraceae bacterium]|nr:ABC transporter ATP-binding protein [Ilumatobacteraceae bacterium]
FREGIDSVRIRRAAEQAHVADEILAIKGGFDSFVGERGSRLSGGQRQRISIARALAGDPQLLIMDEPTSALDVRSEAYIRQTVADLKGSVTIVIIAHRLSTLEVCDRIMIIQDGVLKAFDDPEVLARDNDFFREALALSGMTA